MEIFFKNKNQDVSNILFEQLIIIKENNSAFLCKMSQSNI